MPPEGWRIFLTRFALFCLFAAGLNEVLRRILTFDTWLTFKVFGFTVLFFLFSVSQTPLLTKYIILDEEEEDEEEEEDAPSSDPGPRSEVSSQKDPQEALPGSQTAESDPSPAPDETD